MTVTLHCRQCILTSQMNSFIYKVSIHIFYTVEMHTDFANIQKKKEYLQSQYSSEISDCLRDAGVHVGFGYRMDSIQRGLSHNSCKRVLYSLQL